MSDEFLEVLKGATKDSESTLVLDTNVMMEINSIGDLLKLGDELKTVEACMASPEYRYRQLRSRHSMLVAWWLAESGTTAGIHGNEVVNLLIGKLAPESDGISFNFTTGIFHVVYPFVLKDCRIGALLDVEHVAAGNDADAEILRIAKADGMPVITNEGLTQRGVVDRKNSGELNLRGLCKAAGVEVYTPEEFLAHKGVDVAAAALRFVAACKAGVDQAADQGVLMDSAGGREVMSLLVGAYRWIMLDEVDERFAHANRYGAQART